MKKCILFVLFFLLMAISASAQNSAIEAAQQTTKAEKFLDNVLFFKEVEVTHFWKGDLDIYGKVFIDLTNPANRVGAIEFRTNNMNTWSVTSDVDGYNKGDHGSKSLGFLDHDQIESLQKAIRLVVEQSRQKASSMFYINYIAPGGISLFYKYDSDYEDQTFYFRKVWNITNKYGTHTTLYTETSEISVKKDLEDLIKFLEKSQIRIKEVLEDEGINFKDDSSH